MSEKKGPTVLAVIPARGGSQGVPRKNIAPTAGKPLIAWTSEAAHESGIFTRVIVSTDDREIADVAKKHGCEVPFLRPAELAQSRSTGMDVLLHTLGFLKEKENFVPDYVMYLQPTSPLRTSHDIRTAYQLAKESRHGSVVSVAPVTQRLQWMQCIDSAGVMTPYLKDNPENVVRQDMQELHYLNGAIYVFRYETILREKSWKPDPTLAYVMPAERSIDVDTPHDLYLVDLILRDKTRK